MSHTTSDITNHVGWGRVPQTHSSLAVDGSALFQLITDFVSLILSLQFLGVWPVWGKAHTISKPTLRKVMCP